MPASASRFNIHNALIDISYRLNFEGLRGLRPRRSYIAVQYSPDIRERLKFANGESGYGTLLAREQRLDPDAVLRFLPAEKDDLWWVALAIPKRKLVYGYDKPITNYDVPLLMTRLRGSEFHKPDTEGALFYIKDSLGFYSKNPHLRVVWAGAWGFPEERRLRRKWPKLTEFIADGNDQFRPYPPPETKEKTVTDDSVWGIPVSKWRREPALQTYANKMPALPTLDIGVLEAAYNAATFGSSFAPSKPAAPPPKPEPPKSLAKSGPGGRLIVFPEKEDEGE